MRDIKFRGKTESGEWKQGSLLQWPDGKAMIYDTLLEAERNNARRETLDKVCDWINSHINNYVVPRSVNGIRMTVVDTGFTEDLRKAMER